MDRLEEKPTEAVLEETPGEATQATPSNALEPQLTNDVERKNATQLQSEQSSAVAISLHPAPPSDVPFQSSRDPTILDDVDEGRNLISTSGFANKAPSLAATRATSVPPLIAATSDTDHIPAPQSVEESVITPASDFQHVAETPEETAHALPREAKISSGVSSEQTETEFLDQRPKGFTEGREFTPISDALTSLVPATTVIDISRSVQTSSNTYDCRTPEQNDSDVVEESHPGSSSQL